MKYYTDSEGNYDKEQVMKDIRNGEKVIEIDFSAYVDTIIKKLIEQEKFYKKWSVDIVVKRGILDTTFVLIVGDVLMNHNEKG